MIFHENRLLVFCQKLGKMSQNLSSAAVVIGALRVNRVFQLYRCIFQYTFTHLVSQF